MNVFRLVELCDERALRKCAGDPALRPSPLLPCYRDTYACFARGRDLPFDELIGRFLGDEEDEAIGAISLIAERYPQELYAFVRDGGEYLPPEKRRFLWERVIPGYLPLILPPERLRDYAFGAEYADDVWVSMRDLIRKSV